ncbi:MAG: hypothetical protein QMD80_04085 [archaeon]|nr:hypothetical protein [archaeon]
MLTRFEFRQTIGFCPATAVFTLFPMGWNWLESEPTIFDITCATGFADTRIYVIGNLG